MVKRKSITGVRKRPSPTSNMRKALPSLRPVESSPDVERRGPPAVSIPSIRSSPKPHKKCKNDGVDNLQFENRELPRALAFLEPQLLHISQDVIRSTWKTLPDSTEQKVHELLRSIERPVIARHVGERAQIEAQVALRSTIRTLGKRLPRMPFPPKIKEAHFDYEALLKDNRGLEHHLTSTISSITSLRDEIEKHKQWLASETQDLEIIQTDYQAEEHRKRWQTNKQRYPLRLAVGIKQGDNLDLINLAGRKHGRLQNLEQNQQQYEQDLYLRQLTLRLQSHLDSMQGNSHHIAGVDDALLRTRSKLDEVLYDRLDTQQYMDLVTQA